MENPMETYTWDVKAWKWDDQFPKKNKGMENHGNGMCQSILDAISHFFSFFWGCNNPPKQMMI